MYDRNNYHRQKITIFIFVVNLLSFSFQNSIHKPATASICASSAGDRSSMVHSPPSYSSPYG